MKSLSLAFFSGANVIKLFCPKFTHSLNEPVFVLGKPLQPSVMFSG